MNVLLVDDQPSVISALKSGVNWSSLGITQIFTAQSAIDAKRIIKQHTIDILLSDIEMPAESGLSLLRWCRDNQYTFECIFLTSHADFFYAQEALQLNCNDYILQPARYEDVENAIRKVIIRLTDQEQKSNYFNAGKALMSQKAALVKAVLKDWYGMHLTNLQDELSILRGIGIDLQLDTNIILLKLQILAWKEDPVPFSVWSKETEQTLTDFLTANGHSYFHYFPDSITMSAVLYKESTDGGYPPEFCVPNLDKLHATLESQFKCSIAIYATPATPIRQVEPKIQLLNETVANNVCQAHGVFLCNTRQVPASQSKYNAKFFESVHVLLTDNKTNQVLSLVRNHLSQLNEQHMISHRTLLEFCRDFEQTAVSSAIQLGLNIHEFPSRTKEGSLESFLPVTIDSAIAFIQNITQFFVSSKDSFSGNEAYIMQISKYIRMNLDKPLKCSEVAKAVYLSRGYATQLLQQEKGISLKEFITLEKMTAAQELLRNTTLSISSIASKVGYDNFSHFSQVYKRVLGVSPSEERNSFKQKTTD